MKNEKINRVKSTSRKSVVQAMARQDKENQKDLLKDSQVVLDAIRLKAYELFLERGEQVGNAEQDWISAEKIILQESLK